MKTVVVESAIDCMSDVASLWKTLTDTEYLNRVSGLGAMTLDEIEGAGSARYRISTRAGGFRVEWDECPFEWTLERAFRVRRRMRKGPVASVETSFQFEPMEAGGTRVTLGLVLVPRVALLTPMVRWGARRQLDTLAKAVRAVDAAKQAGQPLPSTGTRVNIDALERAAAELKKTSPPELVDRLVALVRDDRDDVVQRIRPYEWADQWGVDRRALLATCLSAVRAGLLELRWEVICPSCRTAAERLPTLAALDGHGECHLCDLSFGLDVDEAVEATFMPTLSVRRVDIGQYCSGGPARTPHIMSQALLPAGATAELAVPSTVGRYRLFTRGGQTAAVEVTADAPASVETTSDAADKLTVRPGGRILVRSTAADERHVKLERAQFPTFAATARDVTALPAFRRDFSADVLRADVSLRISKVTLFFSDLTGSTQLYSNVGDASALKLVQDHFDVVVKLIEQHGGTLVKTIGDAVMAAFVDETDALCASVAILRAFEPFRRGHPHREQTDIKLGLFAGPSYLVTANGVLDYFGQTVNIAARLQAQAASGELVVEALLAERAVAAGIVDSTAVTERYRAELKGVNQRIDVARIRVLPP
ncbi:MAG: Adenylate cyclase [Myxococcales bacterium]|nr:Adenylate cyclase [Myxococcales bacterium]